MTEPPEGDIAALDPRAAMERIYMEVVRHVEADVRRTIKPVERAREMTQAVLTEIWVLWSTDSSKVVPLEKAKAYAEQAVRFQKVDDLRSTDARDGVIDAKAELDRVEVAGMEDPHGDVVKSELQQKVDAATARISEERRRAWEMRMMGYTYEEIAEELGITEDAARLKYSRASKRLRKSKELKAYLKEER
jgi:RNA polymerase sigma factor (sigma-70 family)